MEFISYDDESFLNNAFRTKSPAMARAFEKVRSVAPTKCTVLLLGETGSGKGVVARLIHACSNRKSAHFVSVHCGAIPDTLLESELFGHERGSFTGAVRKKVGKFEMADGGTIFLDEIGTISQAAQVKLLQVLQDGNFERVGGEETIHTDVRVIAATNAHLKEMSVAGLFRNDLYYRLNVFPIDIPPLRERVEDIPMLTDAFIKNFNLNSTKKIQGIQPEVMDLLRCCPWPGNIRELENVIERACILETSETLSRRSFPSETLDSGTEIKPRPRADAITLAQLRRRGIEEIERGYLTETLARCKGQIGLSAKAAGIGARQLNKLLKKYGIKKEDYKAETPHLHPVKQGRSSLCGSDSS
jgi:transcriptional regulator with GAF, ATPase, and Fis domain